MLLRNHRWLVILLFSVLVGCAPVREWNPLEYSVRPGDTLYSIAWRYEVDFRDIARWNNINPPYAIYPGQRLQLSADDGSGSFGHEAVVSDQAAAVTESEDAEVETEASTAEVIAPETDETSTLNRAATVTVQKGDTLFSIAQRNGIHHSELARWNALRPPYALSVGQVLRLTPPADRYTKAKPAEAAKQPDKTNAEIAAKKTTSQTAAKSAGKKSPVAKDSGKKLAAVTAWHWPVKGKVVKTFKSGDTSRKGISIAGKSGYPVSAAAGGKVVYSGNGLISYGNLIIIKHDDDYLSAYAHNQELLVSEGDDVRPSQIIARMGKTHGRAQLHFEIRKNGKPVNPLQYLPRG